MAIQDRGLYEKFIAWSMRSVMRMPSAGLAARLAFDHYPVSSREIEKLRSNGMCAQVLKEIRRTSYTYFVGSTCAFLVVYLGIFITGSFLPLDQNSIQGPIGLMAQARRSLYFSIPYGLAAVVSIFWLIKFLTYRNRAKGRILLAMIQVVRILEVWSDEEVSVSDHVLRGHLRRIIKVRRKIERLSSDISRDCAYLAGLRRSDPGCEGMDASSKLLLWLADGLHDARRRALSWEMLVALSVYVSDPIKRPPPLLSTAAGRFNLVTSGPRRIAIVLGLFKAPLAIGVIVAVVTALLRKFIG